MECDKRGLEAGLLRVGKARRRIILRKLKDDLETHGLTTQQAYAALLQLVDKPYVRLTRCRRVERHLRNYLQARKRESSVSSQKDAGELGEGKTEPEESRIQQWEITPGSDKMTSIEVPDLLDEEVGARGTGSVPMKVLPIVLRLHSKGTDKYGGLRQVQPAPEVKIPESCVPDEESSARDPSKRKMGERTPSEEFLCKRTASEEFLCKRRPSEEFLCKETPTEEFLRKRTPSEEFLCKRTPSEEFLCKRTSSEEFLCKRLPSEEILCEKLSFEKRAQKRLKITEDIICIEGSLVDRAFLARLQSESEKSATKEAAADEQFTEVSIKTHKHPKESPKPCKLQSVEETRQWRLRKKLRRLFGRTATPLEIEEENTLIEMALPKKRRKESRVSMDSGVGLGESALERVAASPDVELSEGKDSETCTVQELGSESRENVDSCDSAERPMSLLKCESPKIAKKDREKSLNTSEENFEVRSEKSEKNCFKKLSVLIEAIGETSFEPINVDIDLPKVSEKTVASDFKLLAGIHSEATAKASLGELSSKSDTEQTPIGSEPETSSAIASDPSPETESNSPTVKITKDDSADFEKLLEMNLGTDCCITLNGNTISIREELCGEETLERNTLSVEQEAISISEKADTAATDYSVGIEGQIISDCESKSGQTESGNSCESVAECKNAEKERSESNLQDDESIPNEVDSNKSSVGANNDISSLEELSSIASEKAVPVEKSLVSALELKITEVLEEPVEAPITKEASVAEQEESCTNETEKSTEAEKPSEEPSEQLENPEPKITAPSSVPRLRVVHHSELGSRWCPTPLNNNVLLSDPENTSTDVRYSLTFSARQHLEAQQPINPLANQHLSNVNSQQPDNSLLNQQYALKQSSQHLLQNQPNNPSNENSIRDQFFAANVPLISSIFNHLLAIELCLHRSPFDSLVYNVALLRAEFRKRQTMLHSDITRLSYVLNSRDPKFILRYLLSYYAHVIPPQDRILTTEKIVYILKLKDLPVENNFGEAGQVQGAQMPPGAPSSVQGSQMPPPGALSGVQGAQMPPGALSSVQGSQMPPPGALSGVQGPQMPPFGTHSVLQGQQIPPGALGGVQGPQMPPPGTVTAVQGPQMPLGLQRPYMLPPQAPEPSGPPQNSGFPTVRANQRRPPPTQPEPPTPPVASLQPKRCLMSMDQLKTFCDQVLAYHQIRTRLTHQLSAVSRARERERVRSTREAKGATLQDKLKVRLERTLQQVAEKTIASSERCQRSVESGFNRSGEEDLQSRITTTSSSPNAPNFRNSVIQETPKSKVAVVSPLEKMQSAIEMINEEKNPAGCVVGIQNKLRHSPEARNPPENCQTPAESPGRQELPLCVREINAKHADSAPQVLRNNCPIIVLRLPPSVPVTVQFTNQRVNAESVPLVVENYTAVGVDKNLGQSPALNGGNRQPVLSRTPDEEIKTQRINPDKQDVSFSTRDVSEQIELTTSPGGKQEPLLNNCIDRVIDNEAEELQKSLKDPSQAVQDSNQASVLDVLEELETLSSSRREKRTRSPRGTEPASRTEEKIDTREDNNNCYYQKEIFCTVKKEGALQDKEESSTSVITISDDEEEVVDVFRCGLEESLKNVEEATLEGLGRHPEARKAFEEMIGEEREETEREDAFLHRSHVINEIDVRPEENFSILEVKSISKDIFNSMEDTNSTVDWTSSTVEPMEVEKMEIEEQALPDCLRCGGTSSVVCEQCFSAFYCSIDCHLSHWEIHHLSCKPIPAQAPTHFPSPS